MIVRLNDLPCSNARGTHAWWREKGSETGDDARRRAPAPEAVLVSRLLFRVFRCPWSERGVLLPQHIPTLCEAQPARLCAWGIDGIVGAPIRVCGNTTGNAMKESPVQGGTTTIRSRLQRKTSLPRHDHLRDKHIHAMTPVALFHHRARRALAAALGARASQ